MFWPARVFFTLIWSLWLSVAKGQIVFENPSCEGVPTLSQPPLGWFSCSWTPETQPFGGMPNALDGISYIGIGRGEMVHESIATLMSCNLVPQVSHKVTFHAYYYFDNGPWPMYGPGYLTFWVGNDTCQMSQLIGSVDVVDTSWHLYTFYFTPADTLRYLRIKSHSLSNDNCYIGLDGFSDITVIGHADTLTSTAGCVYLTSDDALLSTSVYWSSIPLGFSSISAEPGLVCSDTTSAYLVTTTFECGLSKTDTFWVEPGTSLTNLEAGTFSMHPNPGFDQFTCSFNPLSHEAKIEIFDAVGRLRLSVAAQENSTVVSTKAFPAGFYTVKLVGGGKPLAVRSWVKTQ